jgi:hypothetical protein
VCTENLIRIDLVTESLIVADDGALFFLFLGLIAPQRVVRVHPALQCPLAGWLVPDEEVIRVASARAYRMLLNHFTSMEAISGILIHGLLPREKDTVAPEDVLTAEDMFRLPVVWLTRAERPSDGMLLGDRMQARITVNLPPNGKRLVSWPDELQKLPKWREAERGAMFETGVDTSLWWMYFGTIAPERIVGVEAVSGEPIGPITLGVDVDRSDPLVIALVKTLQRLAIPLAS